jgi:hypothetical protein
VMNCLFNKSSFIIVSIKLLLLVSISFNSFYPKFYSKAENKISIVESDFGSDVESFDLEEDLEEQVLEFFHVQIRDLMLNFQAKDFANSNLNFMTPLGYVEIQLLPPEIS